MISTATIDDLRKRHYRELSKMFYITEPEASTLKSSLNYYSTLTDQDLSVDEIAEDIGINKRTISLYRTVLRKVGFEKYSKRGLRISGKKLRESVYGVLEENPYMGTCSQIYRSTQLSIGFPAFQKRLNSLQKQPVKNPGLEICRNRFVIGSTGVKLRHHEVFKGIPYQDVFWLKKNIEKVGEELAKKVHIRSSMHRKDIPKDLRRAILRASIRKGSDTKISRVYSVLAKSKAPLDVSEILSRAKINPQLHLNELKKLGLVENPERGYWTVT